MKKIPVSFILLLVLASQGFAQKQMKSKIAIAEITTDKNYKVKGILYSVNDSSVALYTSNTSIKKDSLKSDSLPLKFYTYHDIQKIKVRKKSSIAEGALIGGGSGLLLGLYFDARIQASNIIYGSWGLIDDIPPFTPVFTVTLSLIGASAGAIIGSISKKFLIGGDEKMFRASEYTLMKYSFKQKL